MNLQTTTTMKVNSADVDQIDNRMRMQTTKEVIKVIMKIIKIVLAIRRQVIVTTVMEMIRGQRILLLILKQC